MANIYAKNKTVISIDEISFKLNNRSLKSLKLL